uniref:Uncharacterized protein n=1 Tax=Tetradesmus obliquus TaxID=3088 RepID=A0A383WHZ2_TETOB|eukprot:jgi/Sobl393_1/2787/SZX76769.1
MRLVTPAEQLEAAIKDELVEDAPASWQLGPRQIVPLAGGVRLEWRLPVEQLAQACRDSFVKQKRVEIVSPESPPLGGLAWELTVFAEPKDSGTTVNLYAGPKGMPRWTYYSMDASVGWEGYEGAFAPACAPWNGVRGRERFMKWASKTSGLDDAAWAAAGMPTSGEMLLWLHLRSIGRSTPAAADAC